MSALPVRVLLVDDHAVVRAGLTLLLGGFDDTCVGEAADGEAAGRCDSLGPDVAHGPVDDRRRRRGHRSLHEIRPRSGSSCSRRSPTARTSLPRSTPAPRIPADADPLTIHAPSGRPGRGSVGPPALRFHLLERHRDSPVAAAPAAAAVLADLTPREREVLACVGEGLSNRLIARRLGIAEKTVKTHLTRVFTVIGVTDCTQVAPLVAARRHPARARR
jgi:DNA-binding NarL/FixJ family response regulator